MTGLIRRRRRWQGPRKPGTTSMQLWSFLHPPPILSTWQTPNIRDFENLRSFFCSPPSFFNFAPAQLLSDQANPSSALPHFESLTCQILTRRLELAHDHDEERLLGDRPHLGAHPPIPRVYFSERMKSRYNLQKTGKWERIRERKLANWQIGWLLWRRRLLYFLTTEQKPPLLRKGWRYQIGRIFWKNSKRPSTPPPSFSNYIANFFGKRKKTSIKVQNLQYKYLDWKWTPAPPPFSNFFENTSDLVAPPFPMTSTNSTTRRGPQPQPSTWFKS